MQGAHITNSVTKSSKDYMGLKLYSLVALIGLVVVLFLQSQNSQFVSEDINRLQNPTLWRVKDWYRQWKAPKVDSKVKRYGYNPILAGQNKLSQNSYFVERAAIKDRTQIGAENATLVMLVRNSELEGALLSMRSLEDRFNHAYKYPWVFMNDVPFTDEFMEQTALMASGQVFYELIPPQDWNPPDHIDEKKLSDNIANSMDVIYGFSRSYRNMCHFNSGFFYKQKRLLNYDWYFRVEPDVEYMCDFLYDPFTLLRTNNKTYGFTITIPEYYNTIPTLWSTVKLFMAEYPQFLHPNNALDFLVTNETDIFHHTFTESNSEYNMCHFWTNFEIANLNFYRSEAYETYFNYLDQAGGFYYERWGDAPVHSIALALFLDRNAIHHFEDIGYYHAPYMSCPRSRDILSVKRCICKKISEDDEEVNKGMDVRVPSCLARWWRYGSGKRFLNEVAYTFT